MTVTDETAPDWRVYMAAKKTKHCMVGAHPSGHQVH